MITLEKNETYSLYDIGEECIICTIKIIDNCTMGTLKNILQKVEKDYYNNNADWIESVKKNIKGMPIKRIKKSFNSEVLKIQEIAPHYEYLKN
jgi:hypothetical protein